MAGGDDPLAQLASLILGIVCNSCNMECYFSESGEIHSAKRNKLSVAKTAQLAAIGLGLKHVHAATGEARKRLKQSHSIPVHGRSEEDVSARHLGDTDLPPDCNTELSN